MLQNPLDGLSDYIARLRSFNWRPATLPDEFLPFRTKEALRENERTLGDITPRKPAAYDLRDTFSALKHKWTKVKSLEGLERRHMKRAPWVMFYPPNETETWLANDQAFTTAYIRWLIQNRRASSVASLIISFLLNYPNNIETFHTWRRGLMKLLDRVQSVRLNRWRERCEKYSFLTSDGSTRFASMWSRDNRSANEILTDAGLINELAGSKFLVRVFVNMLRDTRQALEANRIEPSDLEKVFALSIQEEGTLRFPQSYRFLAHCLLLPFVGANPPSEIQEQIQRFLLTHLGDPRISSASWQGVDQSAREVMLRWLVGATLEDFFRLLDHTALDMHWHFRKTFWSAYLKHNLITDSWVILGPQARRIAKTALSDEAGRYGHLYGGYRANQSVLLLKVGGITVTEWSHEGTCRLWLQDNERAPRFYQTRYSRNTLMQGANHRQIHYAAKHGTWQRELARWIEDQTGIRLMTKEYLSSRIWKNI